MRRLLLAISILAVALLVFFLEANAQAAGRFDLTTPGVRVRVQSRWDLSTDHSGDTTKKITRERTVERTAGPLLAPAYRTECAGGVCRRVEVGPAAKSEPIRLFRPLLRWRLR